MSRRDDPEQLTLFDELARQDRPTVEDFLALLLTALDDLEEAEEVDGAGTG